MPLWRIFAHPDTFSYEQRKGISAAITKLYTSPPVSLPAFYVNVIFIDAKEDQMWIGGEQKSNFVRIVIEQIARAMPTPDTIEGQKSRTGWMDMINEVLTITIRTTYKLTTLLGTATFYTGSQGARLGASHL
jgi:hypothetical protein